MRFRIQTSASSVHATALALRKHHSSDGEAAGAAAAAFMSMNGGSSLGA